MTYKLPKKKTQQLIRQLLENNDLEIKRYVYHGSTIKIHPECPILYKPIKYVETYVTFDIDALTNKDLTKLMEHFEIGIFPNCDTQELHVEIFDKRRERRREKRLKN